jgi:hypothetical protein
MLLEYIKLPEIQQELKEELENNPFIKEVSYIILSFFDYPMNMKRVFPAWTN